MPEFGGSCGGGGRYDKMVGRFTGKDVPACGFSIGFERIIRNCSGLGLEYIYLLTEEYNLLNVNCPCWQGDKVKYNRFIDLLREVANKENIPQTGGYHVNDMFGFGRQGLAIAFSHGIPDACPAFFYWDSPTWKPLIKRPYHRP